MSNNKLQLRHGRVTDPQTRGLVATDLGLIAALLPKSGNFFRFS